MELAQWLKWYRACLANMRSRVQTPVVSPPKKGMKNNLMNYSFSSHMYVQITSYSPKDESSVLYIMK
jgi:hypothetical protein